MVYQERSILLYKLGNSRDISFKFVLNAASLPMGELICRTSIFVGMETALNNRQCIMTPSIVVQKD